MFPVDSLLKPLTHNGIPVVQSNKNLIRSLLCPGTEATQLVTINDFARAACKFLSHDNWHGTGGNESSSDPERDAEYLQMKMERDVAMEQLYLCRQQNGDANQDAKFSDNACRAGM